MPLVYLNGEYKPLEQAYVSVLDRGFTFGDGVYEVIPVFNRTVFRLSEHLQRLANSLRAIYMDMPLAEQEWQEIFKRLIDSEEASEQSIYLQVTRGVSERDHDISLAEQPTIFVMSRPIKSHSYADGIKAVTHEDIRWSNCHIKAITLLPSVMLRHYAKQKGAKEAILIKDGQVTEGAASNVFVIKDGEVLTCPDNHTVLPGITRSLVLELLQQGNIPFKETSISCQLLKEADELWVSSSTWEIVPVTELDDMPVGNGNPGPVWKQAYQLYQNYKQSYCQS